MVGVVVGLSVEIDQTFNAFIDLLLGINQVLLRECRSRSFL